MMYRKSKREILAMKEQIKRIKKQPTDSVCGLCKKPIHHELAEGCWVCGADLCGVCWEGSGACIHPKERRAEIMKRIVEGPIVGTAEELYWDDIN